VTGRLSAFEPNLQAVPRETETYKVKDVFVARPGYVLMEGDLSQAEIRLASHYGKELEMKRIVMAGLDMHTTVSNDLKIPRDAAKRINFSVIYGIGAKKLADNLKIPIPMATEYLTKYHTKFPGFKRLYNAADRDAQNQGYIRMFTGRLRHYDQFNPTHKASSNLVQGGVGEIMRLTILWIDENLPDVRQLLMVHDSVVMEVPEGRVDEVAESIQAYVASFPFDPPQRMDLKWGPNWGEMKKWEKKKEAMSA
jgi:DNA polymerase-1